MFSLKTWTVSPAITRTKTRNSTRGILQLRLQFNYPDEFGTQKKVSSEAVPLTKEQRSLPNDATQLASNDSKRAQIIPIPFSAETTGAQVLDTKLSADFLGFPVTREQRSLPNDATQLASNDSKRAQIIPIPFSAETTGAQVLDTKLSADFLDFFAHLRVKSNEALDVDEIFLEE